MEINGHYYSNHFDGRVVPRVLVGGGALLLEPSRSVRFLYHFFPGRGCRSLVRRFATSTSRDFALVRLAAWLLVLPPRYSFAIQNSEDVIGLFLFLVMGLAIAGLGGAMRSPTCGPMQSNLAAKGGATADDVS